MRRRSEADDGDEGQSYIAYDGKRDKMGSGAAVESCSVVLVLITDAEVKDAWQHELIAISGGGIAEIRGPAA